MKKNSNLIFYLTVIFFVLFDQLTKLYFKGFNFFGIEHQGFYLGETVIVIEDFLMFTFVENPGMAFGIGFGTGKIFLSLFSVVASIALVYYLYKLKPFSSGIRLGISFILAGAVGNLIDRVFYGVIFGEQPLFYGLVVDFIQVNIPDIKFAGLNYTHWPVFNIADACVTVGVVVLLIFHKHLPSFTEVFGRKSKEALEDSN